jgi:hypothetical protein
MSKFTWLGLQLFGGEGAGAGTGAGTGTAGASDGAATGEAAANTGVKDEAVDAEQRLRELGVPEDKIKKHRARRSGAAKLPEGAVRTEAEVQQQQTGQDAVAIEGGAEENPAEAPERMTWDEIMADPEYNKQMQQTVQARLKTAKAAEDTLSKLQPALELIAEKYKLDPANLDADALAEAISSDDDYYEQKAMELGVSPDIAKKLDQLERETARQRAAEQRSLEEQAIQNHLLKLHQQGEAMKAIFPNFDLQTELQNPVFAKMTAPNVGISVEDAYKAVHHKEIAQALTQAAVKNATQKVSNAIQSGQNRPDEAGASGRAASVTNFDYSKASKEEREALKKEIRAAAARGEKIYPGR